MPRGKINTNRNYLEERDYQVSRTDLRVRSREEKMVIRKAIKLLLSSKSLEMKEEFTAIQVYKKVDELISK